MKKEKETINKEELQKKTAVLGLTISLVEILCGVAGIYAFYNDSGLISVFGGVVLVLTIAQIIMGHQIVLPLIGIVIGIVSVGQFWVGTCIGICFEAVFAGIVAYILVLIAKIRGPVPEPLGSVQNQDAEPEDETEPEAEPEDEAEDKDEE